jgi:hypothetical protein
VRGRWGRGREGGGAGGVGYGGAGGAWPRRGASTTRARWRGGGTGRGR